MRKRTNLTVICTPDGTLINFQTPEQIAQSRRRIEFFKCGGTAELYLFTQGLKKSITEFKKSYRQP